MNAKELFEMDFLQAAARRDYREMADIYEEMDRFDSYADIDDLRLIDSDDRADGKDLPSQYCFADIQPGNKVRLPEKAINYISHFECEYIYCLEEENIKLAAIDKKLGDRCNNLIYEFYEEEGIDTKTVKLSDTIYLDELAMRTLGFRVGDILKIWLLNDMIVISEVDGYSDFLKMN